jgi:hypothetical protein
VSLHRLGQRWGVPHRVVLAGEGEGPSSGATTDQ